MKKSKPKMKMFQYGNKNPGPGREQAEREAVERRKLFALDAPYSKTDKKPATWVGFDSDGA